ncbi:MAG TPA: prenyltransferase [Acidimicrobiia bacterium]|nr:prenyltransferase [Acidimicrobiia bacterium]
MIRLARPHFLLGGALLFALGAVAAGGLTTLGYVLGQAMVSSIQLTAQLVNEYSDAEADAAVRNRTWFSGGSGAIADGTVDPQTALRSAQVTSLIATAAIGAVALRSPGAAAIGAIALAVAWAYSIEPIRLLGTGIGEIVTTFVVAGGVPLVGAIVDGGRVESRLWWAIAVLVPIHLAMMLGFELPDLDTDRVAGKRVLAVRLGGTATLRLVVVLLLLAGGVLVGGISFGALRAGAAAAGLAGVPGLVTATAMRRRSWAVATAASVATLVVAVAGLMPGLAP